MNNQLQNQRYEAIAWGALFIWWGINEMVKVFPAGVGGIGIAVILLGLNAARYFSGIKVSAFSIILGFLMLLWGGLDFAKSLVSLSFDLPVFPILLIAFGGIMLIVELVKNRNSYQEK